MDKKAQSAPGYGLILWCAIGLLVTQVPHASITVSVTDIDPYCC